ncbi:MAG: agmatinase family protein [Bacteroidia bacterium]|nr:agmatinase family protein [Bacteroidia bacterium]
MHPEKKNIIENFDPNSPGNLTAQIFGLPFPFEHSEIVLLPVPWQVTVSYGAGTIMGPDAIREASMQVDLYDPFVPEAWKHGIFMLDIPENLRDKSVRFRQKAERVMEILSGVSEPKNPKEMEDLVYDINTACSEMNQWVYEETKKLLDTKKTVGLIGGDHSTPLGFIRALSERYPVFGILQIDAHADLRNAYEGFTFSHASIMYNALKFEQVKKLIQVGIRDYCDEEVQLIRQQPERIKTFFDRDIKHSLYRGDSWDRVCNRILHELPENIYLSFDIDGLDPSLCPNTGTPVAGGFQTEEVLFLLEKIALSGKKFIGFDLNEVSPGDGNGPDANVAARLLYRICNIVHSTASK